MSSIIQTESTLSNFQLIVNEAFANYTKQTGIDLSNSPFAEKLQVFSSPAAVLEHLREQENAFKEYRDGDRRLIACLSPAVPVLCAFAATLGEAVNVVSPNLQVPVPLSASSQMPLTQVIQRYQVPFSPFKAVFVGIDILFAVRPPQHRLQLHSS